MAGTTTTSRSTRVEAARGALAADPFTSLRFHFGMLLGVEDFEAEQAYHRGKQWFHTAWLHGTGVVWGYAVGTDLDTGEIRVGPGLAVDAAGRELYLPAEQCLDVAAWYDEHQDEPFDFTEDGDSITFDARVVVRFGSCLDRQVPAIGEECNGSSTGTAYSRVEERPELLLRPLGDDRFADQPVPRSHLVRLLFGLEAPLPNAASPDALDASVLAAQAAIAQLPPDQRPRARLEALRRFAALDGITAGEVASNGLGFPYPDADLEVTLAEIRGITVTAAEDDRNLTATGEPDPTVRPSLLPTRTIQELLSGTATTGAGLAGPSVIRDSVTMPDDETIVLVVGGEVLEPSLGSEAFRVSAWADDTGWSPLATDGAPEVQPREPDSAGEVPPGRRIRLGLDAAIPDGVVVRLVVRGTGPFPVLGEGHVPLAGDGSAAGADAHDGIDFVHMEDKASLQSEEDDA